MVEIRERPESFSWAMANRVDKWPVRVGCEEEFEVVDINRHDNFEKVRVRSNGGIRYRVYDF